MNFVLVFRAAGSFTLFGFASASEAQAKQNEIVDAGAVDAHLSIWETGNGAELHCISEMTVGEMPAILPEGETDEKTETEN